MATIILRHDDHLFDHRRLKPATLGLGRPNENGDVELSYGHLTRRQCQHFLLRGSRDVGTKAECDGFWARVLERPMRGGTDGALEVFIFPVSGTATQEQDWTIAPGFPRFEDGQTEATATFTALVDGRAEGAEGVVLNLHGGMGPGQGSSLLVTIADLDGAASGFTAWAEQALGSQPPALRAATADADGDSLPNWIEFL